MVRPPLSAQPPRIGLTTYREPAMWGTWNEPADLLPATYAQSIELAGGAALLLPPPTVVRPGTAESVLDGLHGLVISGGADVDPSRYGAERSAHTGAPRPDRDEWELRLVRAALAARLPVLAICRGLQVLNVALGGDLVQHLPDAVGHEGHRPVVGEHGRHDVTLAPGTRIADLLGATATVATYHHQAVAGIAEDLAVTGWAEDGTVEALEHASAAWVVGVQWHPEVHAGAPLFAGFVAAAGGYRADRDTRAQAGA